MSNSSQQEPHNRQDTRNRSLSISSGGEISARTEEIQSALEVQVRRLFERFGGGALWNRSGQTSSSSSVGSSEDDNANSPGTDSDTRGNLRGTKKTKWSQKLYSPFRDLLGLVYTALLAIMNAAVAIFGVGVGVGLILGDSFRGSARAGDMDDDFAEEVPGNENERRRRGRRSERHGQGSRRDGRALGRHEGGAFGGYNDPPSLSTLPAQ